MKQKNKTNKEQGDKTKQSNWDETLKKKEQNKTGQQIYNQDKHTKLQMEKTENHGH